MVFVVILCDLIASGKSKMAAFKLEMRIFQLVDRIAKNFDGHIYVFWV